MKKVELGTAPTSPPNFRLEELRGIFTIGAIAAIAAFKMELQSLQPILGVNVGLPLEMLAGFWSLYVLFMAISFSRDGDLPKVMIDGSATLGRALFSGGAGIWLSGPVSLSIPPSDHIHLGTSRRMGDVALVQGSIVQERNSVLQRDVRCFHDEL
jgi:hypothetical protein